MSLKSRLFYWYECDNCGEVSSEIWENWPSIDEALDYARGIWWHIMKDGHFCPRCYEA